MGRKLTTKEFIKKAQNIHKEKYNYSLVDYKNSHNKITIICPTHGEFIQKPNDHLGSHGCVNCRTTRKINTNQFIEKAKLVHGNKYNYSKTNYTLMRNKIIIICTKHGEFIQVPVDHLSGNGCQKCAFNLRGWSNSSWKKQARESIYFDSFKVYVIKCWNDFEEFYKIGKTFTSIKWRFRSKVTMPYNYEVIKIFESKTQYKRISKLERILQRDNRHNKYIPKLHFKGMGECFNKIKSQLN